jgi:hypothetical protein
MDTMEAAEWLPRQIQTQMQVLRNDLDVALAALAEARRREEALSASLDALTRCLLAERRGEASAAETDQCLAGLQAGIFG